MYIQSFTFNALQENTYVLWDDTKECVIVDAGCFAKEEQEALFSFIEKKALTTVLLLSTHSHIDHVLGNYFVKKKYNMPFKIHQKDEATLLAVKTYAAMYGYPSYQEQLPDELIAEGNPIIFGSTTLQVLFVPGHAPGHIAFYHPESKSCIAGDVLFAGSVGRADLPGGNFDVLINSIKTQLYPLGDDVAIYAGHGPATTIGKEKKSNPFLNS